MELNKKCSVNIISQPKPGSFIVVPQSNEVASKQCQNYRKNLLIFKECRETNEWFEELDYPLIEIGKVVLVKVNNTTNEWARGIISKYKSTNLFPEIYLIDSQTFIDRKKQYELRICPSKYLRLKLPTFSIHVDLCFNMDDASLKNAIEMMIHKNQHGELNIIFTPQSMLNNEYIGSLIINNLPLNRYLQILLKKCSTNQEHKSSSFNPLHFYHLKNIFLPRNSNLVFLNENMVSSFSDLSVLDDSLENSSSNFLTNSIDNSEDSSDDSSLKTIESSNSSCIIPIEKQKVCSSKSSSSRISNSSTCSLDNKDNSPECLSENQQTNFMRQNDEKHQVPINPKTFSGDKNVLDHSIDYSGDFSDDSSLKTIESSKNSCYIPISKQKVSVSSSSSKSNSLTCSLDNEDDSPECLSESQQTNFTRQNDEKHQVSINRETTDNNKDENKSNVNITSIEIRYQDINEDKPFIYSLMKKRSGAFKKEAAECQQNSNVTKISNVLEKPKISLSDSNLWWSSEDES